MLRFENRVKEQMAQPLHSPSLHISQVRLKACTLGLNFLNDLAKV